jgi:hypothetical protein
MHRYEKGKKVDMFPQIIHILGPAGQQTTVAIELTTQEVRSVLRGCAKTWGLPIYDVRIGMTAQAERPFVLEACPRGWTFLQEWRQQGCPDGLYFRLLGV